MRGVAVCLISVLVGAALPIAASAEPLPEQCRLVPVRGSCKAIMDKAYFDQGRRKCLSFIYDGCGPVVPFDEVEDCRKLCETGAEIRLADFRRVEGRPVIVVDVEYPKAWKDDPAFVARVNGTETASRMIGGGSSPDTNLATLEVFLGTAPLREISIETTVGDRAYRVFTPLFWETAALLLLLDHEGRDEAVLAPADLRFATFKTGAPVVRHNGRQIPAESFVERAGHVALWRVAPEWVEGRNEIAAEATGVDGGILRKTYTFVNLEAGSLPYRQKIRIAYGVPGSRSGPFYRLESSGETLALGADATIAIDAVDDWGWLVREQRLVREVVGAAGGESVLRIYEKAHFLGDERLTREIRLRVVK